MVKETGEVGTVVGPERERKRDKVMNECAEAKEKKCSGQS